MKSFEHGCVKKKLKKCRLALNIATAAIVLAFTVYNMIPKDEKISEVNAQRLADSFSKRIINDCQN